jgi:signal peptidase I
MACSVMFQCRKVRNLKEQALFFENARRMNGSGMNNFQRWSLAFIAGGLLVFLAAAWAFFAPVPIGGQATYVIINGSSMEPNFHLGDLEIVRAAQSYNIGDEVTYWDADLNRYVFHRIVGEHLNHYILKGDNNAWTDSYQPTTDEILGKAWIYVPDIGKSIQWLRTPWVLAVFVGAGVCIVMVILFVQPRKKKVTKSL